MLTILGANGKFCWHLLRFNICGVSSWHMLYIFIYGACYVFVTNYKDDGDVGWWWSCRETCSYDVLKDANEDDDAPANDDEEAYDDVVGDDGVDLCVVGARVV